MTTIEELHAIRERHYEETKNKPFSEIQKEISESADRMIKKMEELKNKKGLEPVG